MHHLVKALEAGKVLIIKEDGDVPRKVIIKWCGLYVYAWYPTQCMSDMRFKYVDKKPAHRIAARSLHVERG